jgi:Carboxypeptidase regulatory-like domain
MLLTYIVLKSHNDVARRAACYRPIIGNERLSMHRLRLFGLCALAVFSVTPSMAQQAPDASVASARATAVRTSLPQVLPGTCPSAFATIQGNALDSTNGVLPNRPVRLRNTQSGRISGSQMTDTSGFFSFTSVDPGTYVVELTAKDQTVLATSQLLTVSCGDTISAVVKLPSKNPPFAGLLGHTVAQAIAITSAAAASGVLAAKVSGVDASAR